MRFPQLSALWARFKITKEKILSRDELSSRAFRLTDIINFHAEPIGGMNDENKMELNDGSAFDCSYSDGMYCCR